MRDENNKKTNRVWDLPIRLFHILIIGLVGFSWYTAENMHVFTFGPQSGPSQFDLHVWSGVTLLVLVLFRIIWGLVGSDTARFSNFIKGPVTVLKYLRSDENDQANFGHNPLGGWAIAALLVLLLLQPTIGLLSSEDTFGLEGPLKHLVDTGTSYWLAEIHELLFNILLALIVLHLGAVFVHLIFRAEDLVGPMITGRTKKSAPDGLKFQPWWRALIVLAVSGLIVWTALTLL